MISITPWPVLVQFLLSTLLHPMVIVIRHNGNSHQPNIILVSMASLAVGRWNRMNLLLLISHRHLIFSIFATRRYWALSISFVDWRSKIVYIRVCSWITPSVKSSICSSNITTGWWMYVTWLFFNARESMFLLVRVLLGTFLSTAFLDQTTTDDWLHIPQSHDLYSCSARVLHSAAYHRMVRRGNSWLENDKCVCRTFR